MLCFFFSWKLRMEHCFGYKNATVREVERTKTKQKIEEKKKKGNEIDKLLKRQKKKRKEKRTNVDCRHRKSNYFRVIFFIFRSVLILPVDFEL